MDRWKPHGPVETIDAYGYVPEAGETLIRSDDVACILVFRDGRPIKIISPNGSVAPFAAPPNTMK
jgi:hypothetical protein